MTSPARAAFRAVLLMLWTLACLIAVYSRRAIGMHGHRPVAARWHRGCWRIMGFSVHVHGVSAASSPTLFVANHVSYLDILVLGGVVDASFVSKDDVSGWPVISYFARLQRTVFVERTSSRVHAQRNAVVARLQAGDNLILFPEGTSNCGNHTLPFKTSLFSVAELEVNGRPLTVQPVSIAYTALNGLPTGRSLQVHYAWYGDMELAPHFWRVLGLGHTRVDVVLHPPVALPMYPSRKALAQHCRDRVAAGAAAARAGRLDGLDLERDVQVERSLQTTV